jgi:hypothetical protein
VSDHYLTGVIRKTNCTQYPPRKILARNYKNYSAAAFKNDLRNQQWYDVILRTYFNTAWDQFKVAQYTF